MKTRAAACPSCGGPVEFRISTSMVTVCPFCNCVVARGDKSVKDHGRVADLIETWSPVALGSTGAFHHKRFEVIGRVQYRHPAGGVWDEWYLSFSNGLMGWLAEAQGKQYLTFEKKLKSDISLPAHDALTPGQQIVLGRHGAFTVGEVGVATTSSAQGEIPWSFVPDRPHRFVDLYTEKGGFATLAFGTTPVRLFLGQEVSLAEIGLAEGGWTGGDPEDAIRRVAALSLNCPQCGGALELKAPDQTQRVGCPHCNSLLGCDHGRLEYLQTLNSRRVKPEIPLGAVGKINNVEYTVIGFMERFAVWQGTTFPWTEYLLYNAGSGFRWLVCNKRHWSFVEPVPPHEATENSKLARYNGRAYKLYDRGTAHVRYVVGEFYWKVSVGDTVETADFISPPEMLSFEVTSDGNNKELNVSRGTYIATEVLQDAFQLKSLAKPFGVGTIQPRPNSGGVYPLWLLFGIAMLIIYFTLDRVMLKSVDTGFFLVMLGLISVIPVGMMIYRHNFEVQRWADSDYSPYSKD
jgi:hypothetical protein